MKRWWISWYDAGTFSLPTPWWISGWRLSSDGDEQATICAAVLAESEDAAVGQVLRAHDVMPAFIEWRFVEERPSDWEPFSGRFPRAPWMEWPPGEGTLAP